MRLGRYAWLIFFVLGLLAVISGLQSLCILCTEPDHWAWLTRDSEALDYLNLTWRWLGINSIAFGILTMVISATVYRRADRWAWYAMWIWPAYLIAQGVVFPWRWPVMDILLAIATLGLLIPFRRFFPKQES